jgi:hypothetical protein
VPACCLALLCQTLTPCAQVGELVRLSNNEDVPADMVLLASSDPHASCLLAAIPFWSLNICVYRLVSWCG